MNDPWIQFKKELKEYWSFCNLPTFSSLKVLEGNILKILTILGFLSLFAFGWFLRSEGIPYSAISWDIHFVSFFSFLFSIMFWCLISAPLMMYLSELLSMRESVLTKKQQWLCSFWCRCFGFSFFLYFFILGFCSYKEQEFYYVGYVFFIAAFVIFSTVLYFFIAEENKDFRWSLIGINSATLIILFLSFIFFYYFFSVRLIQIGKCAILFCSALFVPVLLFLGIFTVFSKSPPVKHSINAIFFFYFIFVFFFPGMTSFIKFTLHEFKIGGDYPVHLVIRQDIACREYSIFIETKNACVINPLDPKELKTKEVLLVMNPGHDNFFVKEKNSANKSVEKQKLHTVRHRDARIIY